MVKKTIIIFLTLLIVLLSGCQNKTTDNYSSNTPEFIGEKQTIKSSENSLPDWIDDSVMYEVNIRQYTPEGTFEAFEEHLPRLKDLGVEILWFMPIHQISLEKRNGTLGSYYSVQSYYSVNPEFGTVADWTHLVDTAKSMGFRIFMDIVFNHTGWDNPWMTEHPEYYTKINGNFIHPSGTDWYDVAELNTANDDLITALGDILVFWVQEFDIDGFRCDYASGLEKSTWDTLRGRVESVKPDIFFLAEDNSRYDWFNIFNANYGGWDLLSHLTNIYRGYEDKDDLINYLKLANGRYLEGTFPLNFVTNHDINSWNGTIKTRLGNGSDLMTMLSFTLPGMPLIYSGQESTDERMLEFFEKDLVSWNGYDYQDELEYLVDLKLNHQALYNDNFTNSTDFLFTDESDILAFVRYDLEADDYVLVIANLSNKSITSTVHMNKYLGQWIDQFDNELYLDEYHEFSLGAFEYVVYSHNLGNIS